MTLRLSRRDFLKICGMSATSLGFRSLFGNQVEFDSSDLARVAIRSVNIYTQPTDKSMLVYQRFRDDLITCTTRFIRSKPNQQPDLVQGLAGYVHSAHLQKVEFKLNTVLNDLPKQAS